MARTVKSAGGHHRHLPAWHGKTHLGDLAIILVFGTWLLAVAVWFAGHLLG
jgi:hypothetical protein